MLDSVPKIPIAIVNTNDAVKTIQITLICVFEKRIFLTPLFFCKSQFFKKIGNDF